MEQAIRPRLKNTDDAAGTAKAPRLLRTAAATEPSPMKRIAGKMIRFRWVARLHAAPFAPRNVYMPITCREKIAPRAAITARKSARSQNILSAKVHVSRGLFVRRYFVNTGMNEAPSEPSPIIRRTSPGIRKARTKASAAGDVPRRRVTR